jgi:hypothetical protein
MFFVGVSDFTANSANEQDSLWGNHFLDFFHRHCLSPEIIVDTGGGHSGTPPTPPTPPATPGK